MKNKIIFFCFFWAVVFFSAVTSPSWGDSLYNQYRNGEDLYHQEDYDKALNTFIDAQIESPEDPRLKYNIANAHYKTKNYDEAIKSYLNVVSTAQNITLEEKSYYNLGNCLYRQGKLPEAVEYYKKALDLDPNDQDAKYNLEFVREEIKRRMNEAKKRQEEREKKNRPQKQSQDQGKTEGEKEQDGSEANKDQGNEGKQKENKQETEAQDQEAGEGKNKEPEPRGGEKTLAQGRKMSPEEAERWLKSLPDDQKEVLKKQLQKQYSGEYSRGKDW